MKFCRIPLRRQFSVCRAPRRARGLKSTGVPGLSVNALSRPSQGAWIEMEWVNRTESELIVAPLAGRVD